MSKTHTVSVEQITSSGELVFKEDLAISSGTDNKRLSVVTTIAGFHNGEIIGAHVIFKVTNNGKGYTTTNIEHAVEFYNTGATQ